MSYQVMPSRQLVSQADSAMIERPDVPRSRFVGSWTHKTAFDAGVLVPFLVEEVLPGDSFRFDVTAYLRMQTPLFPILDNQRVDTFFFFVPNRLVWSNWTKMMGEQNNPTDPINFTVPQIISPVNGFNGGTLYDYFGIPTAGQTGVGNTISINALPARAYRAIWHQWFRDQNQEDGGTPITGNGPDSHLIYFLHSRNKSADYFTTCLPWPQKFQAPSIPLTGRAPVSGIGAIGPAYTAGPLTVTETPPLGTVGYAPFAYTSQANKFAIRASGNVTAGFPDIWAELSLASATFTVNTLRQAFLVQQLLELDARGGTRYIELVKAHFGVTSPDARQDRPEYIGGGSSPLNVTPIAQTAPGAGLTVGALGGAATSVGQHRATYAATEHGFIIGIINVKSELSYQSGLHRMWSRQTRYDYYWPALSGLGEQAVLVKEIYSVGNANDDLVFGYQERWQEYRTRYSEITGRMRSYASGGTLDAWHLGQRFTSAPFLGPVFLNDTPPMARILAAGALAGSQQYLADILIRRDCTRPIPSYGTPVKLGRF